MRDIDGQLRRSSGSLLLRRGVLKGLVMTPVGLAFRPAFAESPVIRRPVREMGLVGTLFTPANAGRWPAIITLTGGGGGIDEAPARALAEEGFAAFALATHNADGLPQALREIPVEYCERAIGWVRRNVKPDRDFIAIRGWSRGGELALILGAMFSRVSAVLAYAPRTYVGLADPRAHNHRDAAATAAWTWRGRPLSFKPLPATLMEYPKAPTWEDRFGIPIERVNGPILFVSGTMDRGIYDDPVVGCRRAMRRLDLFRFPYRHEHWIYADAGHNIAKPPPFGDDFTDGGSLEATARAVAESWPKSIEFLRRAEEGSA